jgi:hypothetical protein
MYAIARARYLEHLATVSPRLEHFSHLAWIFTCCQETLQQDKVLRLHRTLGYYGRVHDIACSVIGTQHG